MSSTLLKKQVLPFVLSAFLTLALSLPALAQTYDPSISDYGLKDISAVKIGQNTDLKSWVANIINFALGFLGIIAVVIIIYAGFKWMTAGGNEEQVTDARKMIVQAVIGLVIIFAAYIIANFVIGTLKDATNIQ